MQPRGLHGGHHRGIPSQNRGAFSSTISLPNPMKVPTISYEYLFSPLSDRLHPPTRQRAWELLSGSSTLAIASRRLQIKFLHTIGSLQQQMA
jgi:hypothetical protein